MEWAGIRRELTKSLQKVDEQLLAQGSDPASIIGSAVRLEVIKTNMFEPALRIADYYNPSQLTPAITGSQGMRSVQDDPALTHALSEAAYKAIQNKRNQHPLTPLLSGSIAALTFPSVSPQHVKAALSVLSPKTPTFPAPTRRANPSYYELPVQDGLKKLLLLGARIDRQVFDMEGTRWVGGIDGGIDGLRAQLVMMLQGFSGGLAMTLESASRNLWFTMEGRRRAMEDEGKEDKSEAAS